MDEGKRTTVVLNPNDLDNLRVVVETLELPSDTEGVRRSLRILRILLDCQNNGGTVILKHSKGPQERVWFL